MKCPFCGKEVEELENLEFYLNDEFLSKMQACPDCVNLIKSTTEKEDFGQRLVEYVKDLNENWEKGTKENAKVGSVIKILELKNEPAMHYVGRSGVVDHIDDAGTLFGTWGGLGVIPETDSFLVLKEEK